MVKERTTINNFSGASKLTEFAFEYNLANNKTSLSTYQIILFFLNFWYSYITASISYPHSEA